MSDRNLDLRDEIRLARERGSGRLDTIVVEIIMLEELLDENDASNVARGPSWSVIQWAADECERQRSGEQSVVWMLRGWERALPWATGLVTEEKIKILAGIVEPRKNTGRGYRRVNVRVGFDVKGSWRSVPRQMAALVDARERLTPDEWFREYEEIHPFTDGNGRTGSILWNWLRGTLDKPEAPPDFWLQDGVAQEETR